MKFHKVYIFRFLVFLFIVGSQATVYSQQSLFSFEKYQNVNGDSLLYRQLIPDYSTMHKYPLVIFLHGSGERGNDNVSQLKWGAKNFSTAQNMKLNPAIVIAPQCPPDSSWSNFSSWDDSKMSLQYPQSKPMELLIELVYHLTDDLPVDTNRIYITGLSMGGYGTFDAIMRNPDLFAAAVPVCGAGDLSKVSTISHIPIWVFTGAEDTTVDPMLSLKMVEALSKEGAHPGFTQLPGVGHFSWIAAYSDPMMMDWLFDQHK